MSSSCQMRVFVVATPISVYIILCQGLKLIDLVLKSRKSTIEIFPKYSIYARRLKKGYPSLKISKACVVLLDMEIICD